MRLTEKRPSNYYAFSKECPEPWTTNCVQKLGKLEDIEEKFCVCLSKLLTADEMWFIDPDDGKPYPAQSAKSLYCQVFLFNKTGVQFFSDCGEPIVFYEWSAYGKRFALTKEELTKPSKTE